MSTYPGVIGGNKSMRDLPLDDRRGIYAMWCVIATEGSLFGCLFAGYYYLGNIKERWATHQPPSLTLPWIMLAVLLVSAFVLRWGEIQVNREGYGVGRLALLLTIIMGLGFLALQYFAYRETMQTLTLESDSYGSIFYAISGLHLLHVIVGILLLAYALVLPRYGPMVEPYRPYQTVALYWYFVNVLWICVFLVVYLIPNWLSHV